MRRIKIAHHTTKTDKSPIEQLRIKYRAFKKANPEKYARVPIEIKLLTKSIVKSGTTVHALAQKLDLAAPSIWSWLKSLDGESQSLGMPSTPHKTHAPKLKSAQEKNPLAPDLEKLKSEYGRIAFSETLKNHESQWRLGTLAKNLIDKGATVDDLAVVTGAHPLTVRAWLKSLQRMPPEVAITHEAWNKAAETIDEDRRPANDRASNAIAEASANQTPPEDSRASNWVKIRVSGHVMEIDWNDLVKRLPPLKKTVAPTGNLLQVPEGSLDFNRAVTEDGDFAEIVTEFEMALIKNALDRHSSVGQCCRALNLPRSTLDAKRRKYDLI